MNKKPEKGEYLEVLLRSPQTIFSTKDVAMLWGEGNEKIVTHRLHTYAQVGKLLSVRRGLYAKDKDYDRFELATRLYTPSYISFETVLTRAGVNFQYYNTIFVASYVTRDIEVDDQTISFIRIKETILTDMTGIEHSGTYSIATKERAALDRIYVTKDYHFDNLDALNWDSIFKIAPLYHNKRLEKKMQKYFEQYKK